MLRVIIFFFVLLIEPMSILLLELTNEMPLYLQEPAYKVGSYVIASNLVMLVGLYLSAYEVRVEKQLKYICIVLTTIYATYDWHAELNRQSMAGGFGPLFTSAIYMAIFGVVFYSLSKILVKNK